MKYLNLALIVCLLPVGLVTAAYAETSARSHDNLEKLKAWACEKGVSDSDLKRALKASDKNHIVFADFGQRASAKRVFVYNLETGETSEHRVSHGLGNAPGDSTQEFMRFSSAPHSRAVPGGVHVLGTEVRRSPRHRLSESLILNGVEGQNRSSAERGITFGDCGILSRRMSESTRNYRSWGSLCLPHGEARQLLPKLKGAALVNFDSRKAAKDRVCGAEQGDHRSDESFERTERLPMDSDQSQIEIHSQVEQDGIQ